MSGHRERLVTTAAFSMESRSGGKPSLCQPVMSATLASTVSGSILSEIGIPRSPMSVIQQSFHKS
eukprot:5581424-Alexandrium_andersonii.AAC.1